MKRSLMIAIVCGILTALFVGLYLVNLETAYKNGTQKVVVLLAKNYIDQGTMLDESMVEEKTVPKDYLQPRAVQSLKELTAKDGRRMFMALVPIEKGEQIITTKLSLLGEETGISSIIPTDRRAVTVLLDNEMVNGIVKPGNRVDVISIFQGEDKDRHASEGAYTVLQNVLVLAAGKNMLGMSKVVGAGNKNRETPEMDMGKVAVSFSVTPVEAEIMILATERGTVRLSLRPTGDDKLREVKAMKMQDIAREMTITMKNQSAGDVSTASRESTEAVRIKQQEAIALLKKYQQK
ncbi:MAG: Flp pilus assembly protein CpaB [Elusimicrobia bacterium]|nr:Flp pilus assembly protein CpaB [Elusimicrobiota bacterium]